jgi:hypothetical protein
MNPCSVHVSICPYIAGRCHYFVQYFKHIKGTFSRKSL